MPVALIRIQWSPLRRAGRDNRQPIHLLLERKACVERNPPGYLSPPLPCVPVHSPPHESTTCPRATVLVRGHTGGAGWPPVHATTFSHLQHGTVREDRYHLLDLTHGVQERVQYQLPVSTPRGHEFWFQCGHRMWPAINGSFMGGAPSRRSETTVACLVDTRPHCLSLRESAYC